MNLTLNKANINLQFPLSVFSRSQSCDREQTEEERREGTREGNEKGKRKSEKKMRTGHTEYQLNVNFRTVSVNAIRYHYQNITHKQAHIRQYISVVIIPSDATCASRHLHSPLTDRSGERGGSAKCIKQRLMGEELNPIFLTSGSLLSLPLFYVSLSSPHFTQHHCPLPLQRIFCPFHL